MKKEVKKIAQELGLRTNQKQKSLFDTTERSKSKPKVYNEAEFITNYRMQRNMVLLKQYPELAEVINEDGGLK